MRFILASSLHGNIEINLTSGVITKADQEINIRAKTLSVLKHLINHQEKVVTKQVLLNEIWHDVVVQEQVLVQSIKEIRDLLGSSVIKTYPRQGYQWVVELSEVSSSKLASEKLTKKFIFSVLPFSILIIGILMTAFFLYGENINREKTMAEQAFTVAFLPVENDMPDDIHDWVPLEGMNYLAKSLNQQSELQVINSDTLLVELLKVKPKVKPEPSNSTALKNTNEIMSLSKQLNVDLIVQTRLLGYPQDFQLHYTLYLAHSIERGIIFSNTVGNGFDQLVQKVAQRFGQYTPQVSMSYQSDFSNEAFTRGIAFYTQRQYQQAIPFFTSALQSNNELLAARRYLAASYINSQEVEKGISLMKKNIKQAQQKMAHREEIRSYLMIGALLINWQGDNNLTEAEYYIQLAKELAEQYQDQLFIAYAHEELAKIKRLQQHYTQAISLLNVALQYHQSFRGNYGQTNALIELARIASAQEKPQQAENYFTQATVIANKNGVATNKVAILLAQAEVQQIYGQDKLATESIQQATTIANQANNNVLKARVKSWLVDNNSYEIN